MISRSLENTHKESRDSSAFTELQQVLVLPMGPGVPLDLERAATVIEQVQLQDHVVADRERWQQLDAVVAIPRLEAAA